MSRLLRLLLLAGLLVAMLSPRAEPRSEGYVFSVTVNTPQELDVVLDRAEDLRELFDPEQHSRIAIVLHGNELQLFLFLGALNPSCSSGLSEANSDAADSSYGALREGHFALGHSRQA